MITFSASGMLVRHLKINRARLKLTPLTLAYAVSTKFWNSDAVSDSGYVSLCLAQINLLQISGVHFR